MTVASDFASSRLWMPTVIDLLGSFSGGWRHLLVDRSDTDEDLHEATDLRSRDARLAVRVRKPGAALRFYWEITITSWRESGAATEFDKLQTYADLMFYGHATGEAPASGSITPWYLVDMRRWLQIEASCRIDEPHMRNKNPSGEGCRFYAYDMRNLIWHDPQILLAASTGVVSSPRRRR